VVSARGRSRAKVSSGGQDTAFVAAVIVEAIKEMRSGPESSQYWPKGSCQRSNESRVNATTWLGSKNARKWFDLSGVSQTFALFHMGWVEYACALLKTEATCPDDEMAEWESDLLKAGIDYFSASRYDGD